MIPSQEEATGKSKNGRARITTTPRNGIIYEPVDLIVGPWSERNACHKRCYVYFSLPVSDFFL